MNKLQKLIDSFNSLQGGVSFINIKNYVSKGSQDTEVQDVVINIGVSYENAKLKDIETLKVLNTKEVSEKSGLPISLIEEAKTALIGALISPREANSQAQKDAYIIIGNGVKFHSASGEVHVFGMKVRKTIKVEGEFKEVKSKPLTIAKDYIRHNYMKSTKYRTYIVERIENINVNKDTIEIS